MNLTYKNGVFLKILFPQILANWLKYDVFQEGICNKDNIDNLGDKDNIDNLVRTNFIYI